MKRPGKDAVRIQHMLDAARKAVEFMRDRSRQDLDKDEKLALAITRLLEIIGEAAKNVEPANQEASPNIPWKQIAGTRNRLIHGYYAVDLDIVWAILTNDLPPLIQELEKLLAKQVR